MTNGTTEKNLKELKLLDSVKNTKVDADWKHLAENSRLIVTGRVEDIFYVVDEEKMYEKKTSSDGIVPLPNLKEGVKGILVRFTTEEVIYTEKKRKINESVNIYVPDGYYIGTNSITPQFTKDKKYLVFLSALEKTDDVKGATVIQPLDLSKGGFDFDYKSAFKVTEKAYGYFSLSKSNEHIVNEVRNIVKKKK
jgi:hypothetical protein